MHVGRQLATYDIAYVTKNASSDWLLGPGWILLMSCRTTTRVEITTEQRRSMSFKCWN